MEKKLPFILLKDNYGAQYQNYFLSIALTNPNNRFFVYENYIELGVKHDYDNHIDYSFDGIYTCDRSIMNKFVIRGPVENLNSVIKESIDSGYYVILNVNEEFLPNRQAYKSHYFRHDLLILGYNDNDQYITVGFDRNMQYSEVCYDFCIIEEAYYKMQNEWDYEVFIFDFNKTYSIELNKEKIRLHLENFCSGNNPNKLYFQEFLKNPSRSIEFVNNSYVGDYYGINVYDYLIERIKKQYKIIGRAKENEKLGVLDLRSLNTLKTHDMILEYMIKDIANDIPDELLNLLDKNQKQIAGVKILILKYLSDGQVGNCRKAVRKLEEIKKRELVIIKNILEIL